mmetsp:Transcript_95532/g.255448  ORF Transcript_95532/g.255448 Transcript_95532/m.255448 type:complete len:298 (-) Transcript_95532:51-944(-)
MQEDVPFAWRRLDQLQAQIGTHRPSPSPAPTLPLTAATPQPPESPEPPASPGSAEQRAQSPAAGPRAGRAPPSGSPRPPDQTGYMWQQLDKVVDAAQRGGWEELVGNASRLCPALAPTPDLAPSQAVEDPDHPWSIADLRRLAKEVKPPEDEVVLPVRRHFGISTQEYDVAPMSFLDRGEVTAPSQGGVAAREVPLAKQLYEAHVEAQEAMWVGNPGLKCHWGHYEDPRPFQLGLVHRPGLRSAVPADDPRALPAVPARPTPPTTITPRVPVLRAAGGAVVIHGPNSLRPSHYGFGR